MSTLPTLVLVLNIGTIEITLNEDIAPLHVKQISTLATNKSYDGIVFHRVIDGFVAQVGDIQHGHYKNTNHQLIGTGGSDLPDIPAEFNKTPHKRGTVSMARSSDPNSANSQFFICLDDARFLDGQYTVFGEVTTGMDIVDKIKKGAPGSGIVTDPDYIKQAYIK
ncbi:peptidylprolyl isomerase [Candidatus Comchoanobacter bicostacola]|uniref:Peptidyl-prolyl cis-trans isomerase n=1 Tax=Candidatus Comchoanobacter bicostacola TaxID=2919598 RepID=A0ABY5DKV5_9GAMM|nr:peptidylprolyl isomerase [Candidatus Comchoanobacter bicostacola]UTC24334.1 peptidylprolyl isomerase [Candidatus Comchoanobacter bicostacola]